MRALSLAMLLVIAGSPASAAESASFLDVGVGARALGMGGAYSALGDEVHALYWNPAGLAKLEKREAAASHAELFDSARMDFLAYAHPTSRGVVSAGLTYLSQPKVEGRDAMGRPTGGFGASDAAVAFGFARSFEAADAGASLKYVRSHIASTEAQTLAADVGLRRRTGPLLLGAALRNLGPGLRFEDQRNDLPLRLAAGAAYKVAGGHAAAFELVNAPRRGGLDASFGGEYQILSGFLLRAGYSTQTSVTGGSGFDAARGMTLGLGLRGERWSLDYAILPTGELGRSHRFSIGGRF